MSLPDIPVVTIVITVHNRLDLLKRSLDSALKQSFKSYEILVIDDGSEEKTKVWLNRQCRIHDCLRVFHQKHKGIAAARQKGLLLARSEFVCILDSDDLLAPRALDRILSVFYSNPDIDLVYTNNYHYDLNGRVTPCYYPHFTDNRRMIRWIFLRPRVPFKHSGTTFRRQTALDLRGYNQNIPLKVDIDLFLKFLAAGRRIFLLEDLLVYFKMHRNSVSWRRVHGMRVWLALIDIYGPKSSLIRFAYKGWRCACEILKLAYCYIVIR